MSRLMLRIVSVLEIWQLISLTISANFKTTPKKQYTKE
uniref:Uncharacterized protein n=1 Tax=Rhizophora mucronata TaxID=61149 RepID=A0A2P2QDW8_RHIMU